MSKQLEWAKHFIGQYEAWLEIMGTSGTTHTGGMELSLYELAQSIVEDLELPSETHKDTNLVSEGE